MCVAVLPESQSAHADCVLTAVRASFMSPPRTQGVATETVSLFTLLLLFSPASAQDPGELSELAFA